MKYTFTWVFLLLFIVKMGAQNESSDAFQIPEVFPVSPTAASLYKHSKIPTNLSSGQANLVVPIYTVEQNGFNLPINLRYNYGGMILEEGPSRTGLGWTLAAAGAISREVRGIPDENPYGYYGVNNIRQTILQPYFANGTEISVSNMEAIANGLYDTEPDVYHVSVGGISFSFKVGENSNVYLLSKHNYLVDFSLDEIIVTDDNGIKYYFSTKETSSSLGEYDDVNGNFGNGHSYTSSWFITRIEISNTSDIFFNYLNKDQVVSYSFMGTSYANTTLIPPGAPCSDSNWGGSQSYSKTVTDQKILSKIIFDNGSIDFTKTDHDFYELYTKVEIKDKQNNLIHDYELNYDHANRDLLTEIRKNNERMYSFDYYNINSLPDYVVDSQTIPTAMDWWGYYNGEISNSVITSVPGRPNAPNKSSIMRYTLAGALSKVTYPSGGTSSFYYEQNEILKENASNNTGTTQIPAFNRRILLEMEGDQNQTKEETFSYTFTEDTYAEISHDIKTYVGMYVELQMQAPGSSDRNYIDQATYLRQQADLNPNADVTSFPYYANYYMEDIGDGQDNATDLSWFRGDTGGVIKIKAGTYNFRLKTWGANPDGNSSIKLEIKFYKDTNAAGSPNVSEAEYVTIGGLRVREIVTCPNDGSAEGCIKRTFEYEDAQDFNQGNYYYYTKVRKVCSAFGNTHAVYNLDRIIYNYKSFTSVNFNSGVPVYYGKVKEGIGLELVSESVENNYDYVNDLPTNNNDDGSYIVTLANGNRPSRFITINHPHYKGGYEYSTFETPIINTNLSYPFTPQSKDITIGRLGAFEVFNYDTPEGIVTTNYDKVKDNSTTYNQYRDILSGSGYSLTLGYPLGLKVARKISFEGGSISIAQNELSDYFYIETYGEVYTRFLASEQTSTDYIDTDNVSNTVSTTYNALIQPKVTETTASNGTIRKTENIYVTELSNPTPDEQLLINQNKINKVVESNNYIQHPNVNEQLLNTTKTLYKNFGNDHVLTEKIRSSKSGGTLEDRIIFTNYDSKGNPTEFSKADGAKTYIIWGYHKSFPIAKLENVDASTFTTQQDAIIDAVISASNSDIDEQSEQSLRELQNDL
ncbi:hypothetical protein, partial [Kordia sp.]|uniref:hypothetical protein n=1 Tax=Kordia sp. TaxID=1965332 RepID=UPI0025BF54E8